MKCYARPKIPRAGSWSDWGAWRACGSGEDCGYTRTRACDNPTPLFGGECQGEAQYKGETDQILTLTHLKRMSETTECFTGWTFFGHTGLCYKHMSQKTKHADALSSCKHSLGEHVQTVHLVSIPDKITNDFLTTVTKEKSWTGGYKDDSGTWNWSDGRMWTGYAKWWTGQPDNWGGAEQYHGINWLLLGYWFDCTHATYLGALCQYEPFIDHVS